MPSVRDFQEGLIWTYQTTLFIMTRYAEDALRSKVKEIKKSANAKRLEEKISAISIEIIVKGFIKERCSLN